MSYVSYNRGKTRAQIEKLTSQSNGKLFFAKDGGIYLTGADGVPQMKADITVPDGVPARFVWQGRTYPLEAGRQTIVIRKED